MARLFYVAVFDPEDCFTIFDYIVQAANPEEACRKVPQVDGVGYKAVEITNEVFPIPFTVFPEETDDLLDGNLRPPGLPNGRDVDS